MKTITLTATSPTLAEVLRLASEENIVLRTADGQHFVLAALDDFEDELARVRQNGHLMQLLDDRSKDTAHVSLKQARQRLQRQKPGQRKGSAGRKA